MKLSIIGTGYVGLVTGVCFAEHGNQVICVDIDRNRIKALTRGEVPFFEPGLNNLLVRNTKEGRLQFSEDLAETVKSAQVHFICVGTPESIDAGKLDTEGVSSVARQVGKFTVADDVLVIKSTVPVGTAVDLSARISKEMQKQLQIVSNPEFLREGTAVEDFMKPDRVIVGLKDARSSAAAVMRRLYSPFVRTGNPILFMDHNSAEMVKLASNGYLATRISYMNELANLCEATGASVSMVRKGMGLDSRIGHRYLFPGLGYGGSCFPKDIQALIYLGKGYSFGSRIVKAVHEVNAQQRQNFLKKITNHFGASLQGKKLAIWGLSFKPNTDDIRDAPSLTIIEALLELGAQVHVYDPEAMRNVRTIFKDRIHYEANLNDGLKNADALCILTEWNLFRSPDFEKIKSLMRSPVIFDGRNLFTDVDLKRLGITYYYMGQPAVDGYG